ncbi:MAG: acylphosphatase [Archaeoglobaceae archaeon]|nr:acylphosphatase [Archaeoglobaceae archaeon]MDW8013237.1 acylphosphatase [Archaeoglobaceae archaeon]
MAIKIVIKGKVHGVGYRVKLINLALEYGIDKFTVFNTFINGKEAVVILVDAQKDVLEILKRRIKAEKPEKALVESIEFEEYYYQVPPIERCMQAFQMEHWGKAIPVMLSMLEKQDLMIQKIDQTREELGKKIDSVSEKIDKVSEKLGETNAKLELLRLDFRDYLEVNMREINSRISKIEEALRKAGLM